VSVVVEPDDPLLVLVTSWSRYDVGTPFEPPGSLARDVVVQGQA